MSNIALIIMRNVKQKKILFSFFFFYLLRPYCQKFLQQINSTGLFQVVHFCLFSLRPHFQSFLARRKSIPKGNQDGIDFVAMSAWDEGGSCWHLLVLNTSTNVTTHLLCFNISYVKKAEQREWNDWKKKKNASSSTQLIYHCHF